ncbi:MAG: O-antigen ligase family protein [Erysipelotrichaceae bacterium]|nr:O-antigen ligase family protein [Erysipelotrichaceae bacterium]
MGMIKKYFKKGNIFTFIFLIVAFHPLLELDYLLDGLLPIPRLTTVINFIVLPLLVLLVFFAYEKNKKRIATMFGIYAAVFAVYYVIHCYSANNIQYTIYLTKNFYFSLYDETAYTLTLLLPLVYVYVFYLSDINERILKKICITLSATTSLPIFISNLFVFGMSTYAGYTKDSFLSWFSLPFDAKECHPRYYATKFFFEEGNTIGILMLMVLPFLYYFLYKEKDRKRKAVLTALIVIHSLSMIILSTRLATYTSAIIPAAMFIIYMVLLFLKKETLQKSYIITLVAVILMTSVIIPYSPAYQNQLIDATNYQFIKEDDRIKEEARTNLKEGEKNPKWSEEWRNFYTYMFEAYVSLINVTPPVYYTYYYDYKYDPEFWVRFIFDYELEERVNGRQLEAIFTRYKWNELSSAQKLTGLGYGTFMRGGIIIERDFVRQYYSYGPIGAILIMGGWIVLLAYTGIKLLLGYKRNKWTYLNISLFMSVCMGYLSSYVSGHTLDELTTSMFISLCLAYLIKELKKDEDKELAE